MDTNRPKLVVVLTVIAGVLVVVDGAVLWSEGSFLNLVHNGLGNFSLLYGQTEALEGFLLIGLGFAIVIWPRAHIYLGAAIIGIAAISFLGGGGFIIGTPLGIAGGILGMIFEIQYYPDPTEYLPPRVVGKGAYGQRPVVSRPSETAPRDSVSSIRRSPP